MGFEERRKERIDRSYAELKELDPDMYRKCVEAASALQFNHGLTQTQSAAVEISMIELVLETLKVSL